MPRCTWSTGDSSKSVAPDDRWLHPGPTQAVPQAADSPLILLAFLCVPLRTPALPV